MSFLFIFFFQKKNNTICSYFLNQDVNNLYGGSQAEALPTSDFQWHPNPEKFMDPDFIKKLTPDDPVGYWLECDIDFGKKLHDKRAFNCYPPLPETKVITYKMLSPKAKKLLIDKIGKTAAKNFKSKKLISTLQNKKKYKLHYLNLQQAMKFGCKLKKVHRVISFKQKRISRNFLNFMTNRRKYSKTKIEERLCKDIANQLYGKSIERVRDRLKLHFVRTYWQYDRLQVSLFFCCSKKNHISWH